jgi:arabinogalactan endo-1,4-beta-galactosidase
VGTRQTTPNWLQQGTREPSGLQFRAGFRSYDPWWHGSLLDLHENLIFMAKTYDKDIIVAEAAYNWAPAEYLNSPPPYPESPEGQKQFLEAVNREVMATPNGRGIGIFYWEPGVAARARGGSAGGRGFFGPDGNALPAITVFDAFTRGKPVKPAGSN